MDKNSNSKNNSSSPSSGGGLVQYIKDVFNGVKSLLVGLRRTMYYFTHHKEIITEQYPDNRATLVFPERFKGEVVMTHDENNEHACTGCTACELACPNATIKIITKFDVSPEGKKKKAIDKFVYHLELCTMCNLCIVACPTDAIKMAQTFEHSVYNRADLTKILNKPGSKIREGVE
ncbi:MAG: 4Fe-4S ferredoxin iron-sulfur binding protein [Ferruginibacter sp.]|jgi:NADH-quinone oxidoreductase subunit I|uniref:4Fe-4S binding protein n=1 Tax=Ferruginibacter sp. TaxID=1940288 RepID=UPI00265AD62C|nr:4Fe-4S binding protein [Ferruginibacter sp.]MDB5275122.1 4Fe-4S ferredoxin iron-sulfur binding protein [Ferruginibacter sp.]